MTRFRSFILTLLFALFLLSVFALFSMHSKSAQEQAALSALFPVTVPAAEESVQESNSDASAPTDENAERFAELITQNADFAGWLSMEGTHINYPVMCTPGEPDFYLRRDFAKQDSISGTPYIGGGCSLESDNIIIYGHNMKDGTMFSDLLSYKKESFFKEHPAFSFDTVAHSATYDILAVFREKIHYRDEVGVFRYYDYTGDLTQTQFEEYLSQIKAASLYDTGRSCAYGDRLITLSTCAYHTENGRFVVVGVEHKD